MFIVRKRNSLNRYLHLSSNGVEWERLSIAMKFNNKETADMIAAKFGGIVERFN